jgi:malate dehydrogenase
VIKLKGSTCYAPGAVIAIMADAVVRGRNRVMGVCTYLNGEYGVSGVTIGVPCVMGKAGVERILEVDLNVQARADFDKSVALIRDAIAQATASA